MEKEKSLYRIIAQKNGVTITAETSSDVSFEEAKKIAIDDVLKSVDYQPFVLLPITSQERWEQKTINFCPRCGTNIREYNLGPQGIFDCYECDTSMSIDIYEWMESE